MTPTIELHIEELALYGFSPQDAFRIGQAVERELTRLFIERGFPAQWAAGSELHISQFDMGAFELPHNPSAGIVGSGLSKALHKGFRNEFSNQQHLTDKSHE